MRTSRQQMENSMRLIVTGCSQTYGHTLPDCYVEHKQAHDGLGIAPAPSKMAFAQLIGDYLGLEVHNLSYPGASTRFMWHQLVHFDYQPTDKVICVWTFPERDLVVQKNKLNHVGTWATVNELVKAYQRYIGMANSMEDLELRSYEHMDHAHRVVAPQVETILHYNISTLKYQTPPDWVTVKFQNALNCIVPDDEMDTAIDETHYGVESHRRFARQMIQDLAIAAN